MGIAVALLPETAKRFRDAIFEQNLALRVRDDAKRGLADKQSAIFSARITDGTIDGKNAETREAQALLAYKEDADWRSVWDIFVRAENAYQDARASYEWCKVDLSVNAILVNAEIAESGATRLLTEISLASV